MTPAQIALVEQTLASVDINVVADDFYRRAFAGAPALSAMFTTDPLVQRERFAAELAEIVRSIRSLDAFASRTRSLGARHRQYGVRAAHYLLMGDALLTSLAAALGESWQHDVQEAWELAYNLTAETMLLGAMDEPPQG